MAEHLKSEQAAPVVSDLSLFRQMQLLADRFLELENGRGDVFKLRNYLESFLKVLEEEMGEL